MSSGLGIDVMFFISVVLKLSVKLMGFCYVCGRLSFGVVSISVVVMISSVLEVVCV